MAQSYSTIGRIGVPIGTLKKIKALNALGVHTLDIPWFYEQRVETIFAEALGEDHIVQWGIDERTRTTTLRWRELTLQEQKAARWNKMMSTLSKSIDEKDRSAQALRASHRDDVADAMSHAIIRSIPKVKPDGN